MNKVFGSFIYEIRSRNTIASSYINNLTENGFINRSNANSIDDITDFVGQYSEICFEGNKEVIYRLNIQRNNIHFELEWQNQKGDIIFRGRGFEDKAKLVGFYFEP